MRTGAAKLGEAECALVATVYQRLQSHVLGQASGPVDGYAGAPGVPYHAMPMRPSSPAATQAKTLLRKEPTGIVAGADQVFP